MKATEIGWEILHAKTQPMDKSMSQLFVGCVVGEANLETAKEKTEEQLGFPYKVFDARVKACLPNITVSEAVKCFLVFQCKGNPGNLVLYTACIAAMAQLHEVSNINMDMLTRAFPEGFPIESEMHRVWEMQKKSLEDRRKYPGSDNWLDATEAWH